MNDEQYPQRRRPAHHAPAERFNEPVLVQVNVCTKDRRPVLACEAGHRLCREAWRAADFWRVGQYVIMPDHIHLFCSPGRIPMPSLTQWVEYWKGQVAVRWSLMAMTGGTPSGPVKTDGTEPVPPEERMEGRPPCRPHAGPSEASVFMTGVSAAVPTAAVPSFKLWQRDFWDTQMRSREHYEEKLAYVRMNPVRKGLAMTPDNWPYQGKVFPVAWM